jgi:hypothetical protein
MEATAHLISTLIERELLGENRPAAFTDTWGAGIQFAKTADRVSSGA